MWNYVVKNISGCLFYIYKKFIIGRYSSKTSAAFLSCGNSYGIPPPGGGGGLCQTRLPYAGGVGFTLAFIASSTLSAWPFLNYVGVLSNQVQLNISIIHGANAYLASTTLLVLANRR